MNFTPPFRCFCYEACQLLLGKLVAVIDKGAILVLVRNRMIGIAVRMQNYLAAITRKPWGKP